MKAEDRERLIHTLNEMIEGHYRVMRALYDLQKYLEKQSSFPTNPLPRKRGRKSRNPQPSTPRKRGSSNK